MMAKRTKAHKPVPTYTISKRQWRWLIACFYLVSAIDVWLGFGVAPLIATTDNWRLALATWPLTFVQIVLLVLLLKWGGQPQQQGPLLQPVEADGESFTPIGDAMEV